MKKKIANFKFIKNKFLFSFKTIIFLLFISCKPTYNEFWATKTCKGKWDKQNALALNFTPTESGNYEISFILTHNYTYLYKNLFLYMEVYELKNLIEKKNLNYPLQDFPNRWLSKGIGALKRIQLKGGKLKFEKEKTYKILVFHLMKEKILKDIEEISIWVKQLY
jgi:gliding motility-associated lipoprotein GldH